MRFDALRITQPSGRHVFAFAATAEVLLQIAEVPRIGRDDAQQLVGYQRPEVASHIAEIRRYLDSPEAVLPNTIVLAFDERVRFMPRAAQSATSEYGELHVPLPAETQKRPGFVVDGQQRLAALANCERPNFPVFVTALIAPDAAEQRKQFVLVNRTKPLPQGLVFELLPEVEGHLPQVLARQRLASILTARLNISHDSSLRGQIKTPTCPQGILKDNSVRRMLLNSLSDGALFELARGRASEGHARTAMVHLVSTFWEGVRRAFGEAATLPPRRSRLTHGVGVIALGYVMDRLYLQRLEPDCWQPDAIEAALAPLAPYCAWTDGRWPFPDGADRPWNELQNTDRDIRLLTGHFRRLMAE